VKCVTAEEEISEDNFEIDVKIKTFKSQSNCQSFSMATTPVVCFGNALQKWYN